MWNRILDKYNSGYTEYLANRCALKSRQNIISSTNWDGSPMVTRKQRGKPLIDTGYMLSAITSVGSKCISSAPYSSEVQSITGNTFMQRPDTQDIKLWTQDYSPE